jgi:hypothetical protein
MFVKASALLYSTAAQINACEEYESSKSITKSGNGSYIMKSERKISSLQEMNICDGTDDKSGDEDNDLSEDSREYVGSASTSLTPSRLELDPDAPLPPFTPGVPGLLSPFPRKMNYGVTPPRPPQR